jgi:CRP-like cAMP-binding protein
VRGTAPVDIDSREVARVGRGAFIGEMAFLGDDKDSATVTAGDDCCCFSISVDSLHDLVRKDDEAGAVLKEQFALDLARKLRMQGQGNITMTSDVCHHPGSVQIRQASSSSLP